MFTFGYMERESLDGFVKFWGSIRSANTGFETIACDIFISSGDGDCKEAGGLSCESLQ